MFDTPLNHFKSVFAHHLFVVPSDRNYFLARFAKTYGMNEEFWWQALQTIEKLLKAGLILNGVSVKSANGHDVESLWIKHKEHFGDLAVTKLTKPDNLPENCWPNASVDEFLARLYRMGQPDSRYGLLGYSNLKFDLFVFDRLAFELRRRTIGLDWIVGEDFPNEGLKELYGQPYRSVISDFPEREIRKMKTPTGSFSVIGSELEDVVFSWNYSFRRSDGDLERPTPPKVASTIPGFGNSHLNLLWEKISNGHVTDDARERIEWLLENVKIGRDAEKALRSKLNGTARNSGTGAAPPQAGR
ncbi:hypothetical protein [Aliishimia ponticola]|uniref:hypothetical protein n=1 Tax=Aliishimia ponticola TaxID=2499833 RepID=UPI001B3BDAEC|nr:hypothetical protein [Aliishimia ponticola]